jgi:hypothetical protein
MSWKHRLSRFAVKPNLKIVFLIFYIAPLALRAGDSASEKVVYGRVDRIDLSKSSFLLTQQDGKQLSFRIAPGAEKIIGKSLNGLTVGSKVTVELKAWTGFPEHQAFKVTPVCELPAPDIMTYGHRKTNNVPVIR